MKKNIWLLALTVILVVGVTVFAQNSVALKTNDSFTVKTYTMPGIGSVNSHYIVTKGGVIVIDSQRVLSQAANLLQQIKASGKPVVAVLLTHAHPDHIGGLAEIIKEFPGAEIYAAQGTIDEIVSDKKGFQKLSKEQMQNDFPDKVPQPTRVVRTGETFTISGIEFEPRDIGTGEAESMTMYFVPAQNVLFSGDIIANRMTPFLLESHSALWLKQLKEAQERYGRVKTVYPGHGDSGTPKELMSAQQKYLTEFRKLVAKANQDNSISPEEKRQIVVTTERRYPNYLPVATIPDLLEQNVDAIAKEMKGLTKPQN